ncbi:hypothetical protein KAJ27_06560, partial [bacterium]|nr:hypothetical protein [bacterium]
LKEYIPSYSDVALLLFPHENSKAFEYSAKKTIFTDRIKYFVDTESVDEQTQQEALNILNMHDYSVGTPPVTRHHLDMMSGFCLGDHADELRKYRSILGIKDNIEEAQFNYLMDVFDQMVIQSSHYTLESEKKDFLNRTNMNVNFKGLNGFIRTVV